MAITRALIPAVLATGAAMALSGCMATTPSYYSERVTERPQVGTVATAPAGETTAPRRRTARRPAAPAQSSASAVQRREPENAPITPRTTARFSARPTAHDGSTAPASITATREANVQRDKEQHDRRERAIRRSIDSICRGC